MRLLATDQEKCLQVIEVEFARYNPYDKKLDITSVNGRRFCVLNIDMYNGESCVTGLYESGIARIPDRFEILRIHE